MYAALVSGRTIGQVGAASLRGGCAPPSSGTMKPSLREVAPPWEGMKPPPPARARLPPPRKSVFQKEGGLKHPINRLTNERQQGQKRFFQHFDTYPLQNKKRAVAALLVSL